MGFFYSLVRKKRINKMNDIAPQTSKRIAVQVITLVVFIVITQAINGFYALYGITPPGIFVLLTYLGLFWLVGDWFMKDSKNNKVEWAFDMGFFLYIFWPLFIPFYLFKTRGFKKAAVTTLSFIALYSGVFYLSYYVFYIVMP